MKKELKKPPHMRQEVWDALMECIEMYDEVLWRLRDR